MRLSHSITPHKLRGKGDFFAHLIVYFLSCAWQCDILREGIASLNQLLGLLPIIESTSHVDFVRGVVPDSDSMLAM